MLLYDRLVEYNQLFNISLWESNRAMLLISSSNPGHIFLLMMAVCLLGIIVLGYGFYIWFFITGSEHSQVRLLNILNVYLSVIGVGGSITAFIIMLTSGLGFPVPYVVSFLAGFHLVAITATFLLISLATCLNQFKPEAYLNLSVAWRHSFAIPAMLLFCIIVDCIIFLHCHVSLENECKKITVRRFFLLPATCISFILQTIVIIEDVWGLSRLMKFIIPTNETPVIHLQNPAQGLQNHVVCNNNNTKIIWLRPLTIIQEYISTTTGFFTLCLSNLSGFLISMFATLLKLYNPFYLPLAWLSLVAFIPVMWISRNKKMKDEVKTKLGIH